MTTGCTVCGFIGDLDSPEHRCAADPQYWPPGMEIPTSRLCSTCGYFHRGTGTHCNIVTDAMAIEGWMNEAELTWLVSQARRRKRVVEFGSYKGRSTTALAGGARGTVYAVDWWPGSMEIEILPEFRKNLAREIAAGKVIVCHGHTARAFTCMREPADMVFIDASHDYQSVKNDIGEARRLMSEGGGVGGLLCGHDFSAEFPGVKRAVVEEVPNYRVIQGGTIWYAEL